MGSGIGSGIRKLPLLAILPHTIGFAFGAIVASSTQPSEGAGAGIDLRKVGIDLT
jgi:hypothetical protein